MSDVWFHLIPKVTPTIAEDEAHGSGGKDASRSLCKRESFRRGNPFDHVEGLQTDTLLAVSTQSVCKVLRVEMTAGQTLTHQTHAHLFDLRGRATCSTPDTSA